MKIATLIITWMVFQVATAFAAGMYVGDVVNISMRTSPGFNQDVIQMISSGQEVTVIEKTKEWDLVRLPDGKEGWVLSRYLTTEKPNVLILKKLEEEHQKLLAKDNLIQQQIDKLKSENNQLLTERDNYKKQAAEIKKAYDSLKEESATFLDLKAKYESSLAEIKEQAQKNSSLGEKLAQRNIHFFLYGAGVLLFGILIGFRTNNNRRRSSLLS